MTELEIKRVVIACDAAADMQLAAGAAAALASRWGAALHGIFFEDENLHRLAELEIAAHLDYSAEPSEFPTGEALAEMLRMFGIGMRQALEAAAVRYGLSWSFGTLRVSPSAFPPIEGDILIVEAGTRPFVRGWRPRAPWLSSMIGAADNVLIRRGRHGRGTVAILPEAAPARDRVIGAARTFSADGETAVLLSAQPVPARQGESAGLKSRFETLPSEPVDVAARVRQLDPNLLVVSAEVDESIRNAILDETNCDLLFVK